MKLGRELLLVSIGLLLGFAGAVSYSSLAQREEFSQALKNQEKFSLELAGGQCRLGPSEEGMWWRHDQEHSNRYKTNGCLQFGGTIGLNQSWEFAARWINLGNATVNSIVVSCPDDDCSKSNPAVDKRRAECNQGPAVDCLQRARGSWNVRGGLLSMRWELFRVGQVEVRPEAGLFLYRIRGTVRVMPLGCDESSCPWSADIVQQTGYYASPEIGLMLRYKHIFVATQYFFRTTQHTNISPGVGGPAQTWIAGVQVAL